MESGKAQKIWTCVQLGECTCRKPNMMFMQVMRKRKLWNAMVIILLKSTYQFPNFSWKESYPQMSTYWVVCINTSKRACVYSLAACCRNVWIKVCAARFELGSKQAVPPYTAEKICSVSQVKPPTYLISLSIPSSGFATCGHSPL